MRTMLLIVVLFLIALSVYWFAPDLFPWSNRTAEIPRGWKVYRNQDYNFSFAYPRNNTLQDQTSQVIAIASTTEAGPRVVAEVTVVEASPGVSYTSFEDFLYERTRLMCSVDGPQVSISCTTVQRQQAFKSSSGLTGVLFYLEEIHTNLHDNTIKKSPSVGPFLAFDLSQKAPEHAFTALVIHPPVVSASQTVDAELLRAIANSVQVR